MDASSRPVNPSASASIDVIRGASVQITRLSSNRATFEGPAAHDRNSKDLEVVRGSMRVVHRVALGPPFQSDHVSVPSAAERHGVDETHLIDAWLRREAFGEGAVEDRGPRLVVPLELQVETGQHD